MQFAPLLPESMSLSYEHILSHSFEFSNHPLTGCCKIQAVVRTLNTK
jgi:hypothetical protein